MQTTIHLKAVRVNANMHLYRVTATWLHDFWIFSFVTAKYWGKGPKNWTLSLIDFKTLAGFVNDPSASHPGGLRELEMAHSPSAVVIDPPTQLCNWSIHMNYYDHYVSIDSRPNSPTEDGGDRFDIEDESTWRAWDYQSGRDLPSIITRGLQDNDFSRIQLEDLPLAADRIVDTISKSPEDASVEAFGFAVMSRNLEVLRDLLRKNRETPAALRNISPFHLAAKYLDGSGSCCGVMSKLVDGLDRDNSIGINYTDNSGLTVLDTLFVSILRSHSSVTPLILGGSFATDGSLFDGGDVDTCGRWDADSPCIRQLHAAGETNIPVEWKHMFCHSSVQAVCHCITAIFMSSWSPNINTPGALFQRRCLFCGLELKLGPLHALVFVAYYLANSGMPGETLFGVLACFVCLLTWRADPCSAFEISIPAVLGIGERAACQHRPLNAAELASAVPDDVVHGWTSEVQLGWQAITALLNRCVAQAQMSNADAVDSLNHLSRAPFTNMSEDRDGDEGDDDQCAHEFHEFEDEEGYYIVKCGDRRLGTIWAAIQVELLTYRRLAEGDPWLSAEFNMQDIVEGLQASSDLDIKRLVSIRGEGAVKEFSHCGLFLKAMNFGCVRREEACGTYFANLDDWKRTRFIAAREDC